MRDYAALERGTQAPGKSQELTQELLGTFIALAWQEAKGIAPGSTAGADIFELVMQPDDLAAGGVPAQVREILQYRALPTGVKVELTELKVGAQATGSIGRLNPQNVAHVYKSHPIEARFVLDQYSRPYGDVVDWVRQRVRAMGPSTAAGTAA